MNQALDQNHHVTALVRSPEKVTVQHENLKVEKCDIFSLEDMKTKCVDADVVISCLGAFFYQRSIQLSIKLPCKFKD